MGLFITKHLVEKMGGQIKIYSKEGKGTVVSVILPIKSAVVPNARRMLVSNVHETEDCLGAAQPEPTVMIVDDEMFIRMLIQKQVTDFGLKVVC
mmetsp:Transcript_23108/g.20042  ORF Transcript_23108/g.20042 Transcript_23108/m.20042 type:complete len:94 (+) Transcript_23108:213-494(+)